MILDVCFVVFGTPLVRGFLFTLKHNLKICSLWNQDSTSLSLFWQYSVLRYGGEALPFTLHL